MKFITVGDLYYLLVIILITVTSRFPLRKLREFIVRGIVFIAYRFSRKKRRLIEENLSLAFEGELSEEQMRKIVKGAFYKFWQDTFLWLPSGRDKAEIKGAEVRGIKYLRGALKAGNGVILWESNGFGRRAASKQILYQNGFPIHQVHGANHLGGFLTEDSSATWARRSLINRFFENCEKQFVKEITNLPSSNSLAFTKHLLGLLKQNAILCISGDGKTGQKLIPLRFLGQTDLFSTGMISLAKISGATILPMFCVKERDGKTSLVIERPIHVEAEGDREGGLKSSVAEYAGLLEAYIGRYPEQYRNWHLVGSSLEIRGLKSSQGVIA